MEIPTSTNPSPRPSSRLVVFISSPKANPARTRAQGVMLRIENLLLRGDGQVSQGRMLEETSLVQGQETAENGGAGGGGSGSSAAGGSVGVGATATSAAPNGGHHESGLGALGATTLLCHCCFVSVWGRESLERKFSRHLSYILLWIPKERKDARDVTYEPVCFEALHSVPRLIAVTRGRRPTATRRP